MIDPANFTNFNRTVPELQEMLLFSIAVAGKRADTTARCLDGFLKWIAFNDPGSTPWHSLQSFGHPSDAQRAIRAIQSALIAYNQRNPGCGLGQPSRLGKAFFEVAWHIDPQLCSLKDLLKIHGIGPKTARLFLLHSRPDQRYAVLDTHILKWLRDGTGIWTGKRLDWVPNSTPTNPKDYAELEQIVLAEADIRGLTPAEFDLLIWKSYAQKGQQP